jgi:hypothetical protein
MSGDIRCAEVVEWSDAMIFLIPFVYVSLALTHCCCPSMT